MKFILFLLFCFIYLNSYADQPRFNTSFQSDNGLFELKITDTIYVDAEIRLDSLYNSDLGRYEYLEYQLSKRYRWSLFNTDTDSILYTLPNDRIYIGTMTAKISNNGESIIFVDDFSSSGFAYSGYPVVYFYQTDTLVKVLSLGDLLDNMCSISYSVSHMMWCSTFGFTPHNEFSIKTYDYYVNTYSLDGILKSRISDSRIKENYSIVNTDIKRINKNHYLLSIKKSIRGQIESGTELDIIVSDNTMRKIHGDIYGIFKRQKKSMSKSFTRTIVMEDNTPLFNNMIFPIYNGEDNCNKIEYYSR